MNQTNRKTPFFHGPQGLIAALCLVLSLLSLPTQAAAPEAKKISISSLAVMPFSAARNRIEAETTAKEIASCPLNELCFIEPPPQETGSEALTQIHQTLMRQRLADRVVPRQAARQAYEMLELASGDTLRQVAVRFGKELGVDYVVTGTVWRYEERVGKPMTAESPASVAFLTMLIRVADGMVVWSKRYNKTQTSLSENLLDAPMFIKKGMKWLSAEELASYGAEKILATFPGQ